MKACSKALTYLFLPVYLFYRSEVRDRVIYFAIKRFIPWLVEIEQLQARHWEAPERNWKG